MSTHLLSEEQRRRFGGFAQDPDEGQLTGFFLLDETARRRAMAAKGARNRIGLAVQLGTVRYLGTFLDDPEDVPPVVVDYVAEQLGLDPAGFAGYGTREARWDHQEQIRAAYGYVKFGFDQWCALARWLYQRAWIGSERPTLQFDLATKRLVEKKVVLPGVSVLERLVAGSRERAEKRLWATLAAAPTADQATHLQHLAAPRGPAALGAGPAAPLTEGHHRPRGRGRPWNATRHSPRSAGPPGTCPPSPPGRLQALVRQVQAADDLARQAGEGDGQQCFVRGDHARRLALGEHAGRLLASPLFAAERGRRGIHLDERRGGSGGDPPDPGVAARPGRVGDGGPIQAGQVAAGPLVQVGRKGRAGVHGLLLSSDGKEGGRGAG
ncbi:DUF4158 domain-containing protein, partial [Streptomyces clavuligerus]